MPLSYLHTLKHLTNQIYAKMPFVHTPAPEELTPAKMRHLFGDKYEHILYYNYDIKAWNTTHYMDTDIPAAHLDPTFVNRARVALESEPAFTNNELVALVVMSTQPVDTWRIWKMTISNPSFIPSNAIIGTIVSRDRRSGKILPPSSDWIGVNQFDCNATAARQGALWFMRDIYNDAVIRSKLIQSHIR